MATQNQVGVEPIAVQELKRRLDAGEPVLVVDVREPEEYADWRIEGSVNVPLGELEGRLAEVRPPEGGELVTVCARGARSLQGARKLAAAGVPARTLEGGMLAWNSVYDVHEVPDADPEGKVRILQLRRVAKGCVGYVLVSGNEAAVVDATVDVDAFIGAAAAEGARIVHVLDTHAHADHVSGGRALAAKTGATYRAPEEVGAAVADGLVRDGDALRLGDAEVRVLATPGHTPGSVTYLAGRGALLGDTLFVDGVGRPDLGQDPRPNARVLWETLHERVLKLPGDTLVLPGHVGEEARGREPVTAKLAEVRERVAPLRMEKEAFAEWAAQHAAPKPGNFVEIKRLNRTPGEAPDAETLSELEAGPNRCAMKG